MRQLFSIIAADDGIPVLARIVGTRGSSPREIGAAMVIDSSGHPHGGLTGGCIEAALLETAQELSEAAPARVQSFGPTGTDPAAVGLACGGAIDVLIHQVRDRRPFSTAAEHVAGGKATWLTTDMRSGDTAVVSAAPSPRDDVFIHPIEPAPRLILVGSNEFVRATADVGRVLGYRVTVVDARSVFTTPDRFPAADDVVVDWPDRYLRTTFADPDSGIDHRTAVVVMSHDEKFDVPALEAALEVPDIFVGALGSRRTAAERRRILAESVSPQQLSRLRSPVGLDLGAQSPEESAVSILAEIVAARSGRSGQSLRSQSGPIH